MSKVQCNHKVYDMPQAHVCVGSVEIGWLGGGRVEGGGSVRHKDRKACWLYDTTAQILPPPWPVCVRLRFTQKQKVVAAYGKHISISMYTHSIFLVYSKCSTLFPPLLTQNMDTKRTIQILHASTHQNKTDPSVEFFHLKHLKCRATPQRLQSEVFMYHLHFAVLNNK